SIARVFTASESILKPELLGNIRTTYNGPRTDVPDITTFRVNRYGAPEEITDALSYITTVEHDATWPLLVSTVTQPTAFATQATYTSRGLLHTSTAFAPFGVKGQNAITTYEWVPNDT